MFLNPAESVAQGTHKTKIYGKVTDKTDGNPVPFVNVYISGTMAGATTEENGSFEFTTELKGRYELVFSYIGYKTVLKPVFLQGDTKQLHINADLEEDMIEFDELVVESDNKEWRKNYEVFEEQFIGTSGNASETSIQNPWALYFEYDENGALVARADEPLIITNNALGYKMHVDLINFKWRKEIDLTLYKMNVRFTEMETESRRVNKWEKNRKNTYEGSFEHFLVSLYEGDLKEKKFELEPQKGIESLNSRETRLRLMESGQSYLGRLRLLKGYLISGIIQIFYGSNKNSLRDNRMKSLIAPLIADKKGYFFITENRNLLDPLSIRVGGEWGLQRVADMVPKEYYTK